MIRVSNSNEKAQSTSGGIRRARLLVPLGLAIALVCAGAASWAQVIVVPNLAAPKPAQKETPQTLLAHGEYDKAITASEAIVGIAPDRADAMDVLVDALVATGDYRKAAERGDAFLKRKADAGVALRKATAWSLVGEYSRAEA